MLHSAVVIGSGARGVLALGVGVVQLHFAEEAEDFAFAKWLVGSQEESCVNLVFKVIEILKTDVEILA